MLKIAQFEIGREDPDKLVEAWVKRGELMTALGKSEIVASNYIKVVLFVVRLAKSCVEIQGV